MIFRDIATTFTLRGGVFVYPLRASYANLVIHFTEWKI